MINLEKIKKSKTISELLEFSILNIDKSSGPTSFSVDEFVKKKFGAKKVCHFGTLDPNVTGVLPIAFNRACRLMDYFIKKNKTYVGVMTLHEDVPEAKLKEIIRGFVGKIIQMPPVRSKVKREKRQREIYKFEILEKKEKEVLFRVECEAGTYIRKLIHDLGLKIGGAHMKELRRTDASIFSENDKEFVKLYDLEKALEESYKSKKGEEKLRKILIPGEIIAKVLPVIHVKREFLDKLWNGSPLFKDFLKSNQVEKIKEKEKLALFSDDLFIGIYSEEKEGNRLACPEFVFRPL